MYIREQRQQNRVADEVSALTAVVRPILTGTLYALKTEVVAEAGGYNGVKLLMLPRLYKARRWSIARLKQVLDKYEEILKLLQ